MEGKNGTEPKGKERGEVETIGEGPPEGKAQYPQRWQPGASGNPRGRKPRMTELELANAIDAWMNPTQWAARVSELALQNDDRTVAIAACRLLAQYRLPEPLKRQSVDVFGVVAHIGEIEIVAARMAIESEERRLLATDGAWRELSAPSAVEGDTVSQGG